MSASKIQPEYLEPGDEVMIVSPAFCLDETKLTEAVDFLARWGLKAYTGKNAAGHYGPFAGTDDERLADLQEATDNPSIKAVFCSRGGYGVSRIIDKVDFKGLKKHPKWYVGFSDITVLHIWLSELHGIMSVHGDMPLNYFNPDKTATTFSTLKDCLFGNPYNLSWDGSFFRERAIKGEITGGNLSLFYSLIGSPAEPDTKGKILFLEEVSEYYYHVDRMLTSLKLAGKLRDLSALVIGGMSRIEDTKIPWGRSIEDTVLDIVKEYNYPVLFDFPAGHIPDNNAFYIGRQCEISIRGNNAVLSFM
ncbi:MAG TPA: LD-carboxypeptidase [Bacteroidales bacterium]|nr:LD-carboxypeptidase [Bacteroidales bacterium]